MVKIAGAVKEERREFSLMFLIKLFNQAPGRAKAKLRSPVACLENGHSEGLAAPGIIQVEVKNVTDQSLYQEGAIPARSC